MCVYTYICSKLQSTIKPSCMERQVPNFMASDKFKRQPATEFSTKFLIIIIFSFLINFFSSFARPVLPDRNPRRLGHLCELGGLVLQQILGPSELDDVPFPHDHHHIVCDDRVNAVGNCDHAGSILRRTQMNRPLNQHMYSQL